jgi:hypothetical protein
VISKAQHVLGCSRNAYSMTRLEMEVPVRSFNKRTAQYELKQRRRQGWKNFPLEFQNGKSSNYVSLYGSLYKEELYFYWFQGKCSCDSYEDIIADFGRIKPEPQLLTLLSLAAACQQSSAGEPKRHSVSHHHLISTMGVA